jgi:hypothetical protein
MPLLFSPPELKALVNYSDHPSMCLSEDFSIFNFFKTTWQFFLKLGKIILGMGRDNLN